MLGIEVRDNFTNYTLLCYQVNNIFLYFRQSLIGDYSRMQFRIYINDICMANKTVLSTRVDQRLVMVNIIVDSTCM